MSDETTVAQLGTASPTDDTKYLDYGHLPVAVRDHLDKFAELLDNIDGKTICTDTGEGTFIDEGIYTVSDFLPSFNAIVRALAAASPPLGAARDAEVKRLLTKITDLVDNEDACEPLDDAINYARQALAAYQEERGQK